MALTLAKVEQAIEDVLSTGETYVFGDTRRSISLKDLYDLRDVLRMEEAFSSGPSGSYFVVRFRNPDVKDD